MMLAVFPGGASPSSSQSEWYDRAKNNQQRLQRLIELVETGTVQTHRRFQLVV